LPAIGRAEAGIRPLQKGYNGALSKVETALKVTTMMRIALSTAAAAALICLQATPSQAQYSGTAPWCAVIQVGTGGVHYDCYYANVEACVPNVLAGNRGFCAMNPYFGHPSNYGSGFAYGYGPGYGSTAGQQAPVTHYRHTSRRQPHKHSPKS
jgi:hypothetical protein